jgi:hypothetical protein
MKDNGIETKNHLTFSHPLIPFIHINIVVSSCILKSTPNDDYCHGPKLLDRFKCESKVKTTEEHKVKAHSLACSTLGVEGRVGVPGWD